MWAVSRITQLPVTCALPPLDSKERVAAAHQHRVRCPERLLHGGLGRRGARDVERAHVHAALHERLALLRAELLEVVRGLSKARLECVSSRPAWGLLVRGSSPRGILHHVPSVIWALGIARLFSEVAHDAKHLVLRQALH